LCGASHWGSLQRSPRPLAVFRGLLLKEGEKKGEERRREWEGARAFVFAIGRKKRKVVAYAKSWN